MIEYQTLLDYLDSQGETADDPSGFAAVSAGFYFSSNTLLYLNQRSYIWTATRHDEYETSSIHYALFFPLLSNGDFGLGGQRDRYSVRCLKD